MELDIKRRYRDGFDENFRVNVAFERLTSHDNNHQDDDDVVRHVPVKFTNDNGDEKTAEMVYMTSNGNKPSLSTASSLASSTSSQMPQSPTGEQLLVSMQSSSRQWSSGASETNWR